MRSRQNYAAERSEAETSNIFKPDFHLLVDNMGRQKISNRNKIEELKPKIIKILKQKGIKKAGIFGSYARGEQTKKSDVDILIEFNGSLLDLVGLEMELKRDTDKQNVHGFWKKMF